MLNVLRLKIVRNFAFLLLFFYIGCLVRDQALYERWLHSLGITWKDFPRGYAQALWESVEEDRTFEYDNYPPLPDTPDKIPPKIHFIWFRNLYDEHLDVSNIPTMGSNAPKLCRKHNPDFEVNIWNKTAARDLIEEHYAWFMPTYDGYKHPIQRVDAFKYFLLYHYGGIYMDLDISCRRPLNQLLEFPAWFPKAQPFGVNNDLMATRAGHPIMGKIVEMLQPRDKNLLFPYVTIFWSTGPQFASDILKTWFHKQIRPGRSSGCSKENIGTFSYFCRLWQADFRLSSIDVYVTMQDAG